MTTPMTIAAFRDKVDIYSADLSRWPAGEVKEALAFMQENSVAADYFNKALALDDSLRKYEPETADIAALEARIMKAVAGEKQAPAEKASFRSHLPAPEVIAAEQAKVAVEVQTTFRAAWLFAPGGGLMAIALVGFFLGFSQPQAQHQAFAPLDPAYVAEEQLASLDADWYGDEGEIF